MGNFILGAMYAILFLTFIPLTFSVKAGASSVGEASTVPKEVRMGVTAVNVKRSKQSNKEQEDQTSTVNVESSDTIDIQDSSTLTASTLETKEIKLPSKPCVATTEIKQIRNIKQDISESDKALMIEVMEDLLGSDNEEDTDTVKMTAVDDGLQPKLPSEPCMTSVTVTTEDTTTVGTSVDGDELATTKDEKGPDLSDSDKKLMTEVLSELIDDTSDDGTTAQQDDIKVTTEVTITTTEQITTNVEVASGIGLTETQTFTQDETAPIETAQEAVETPPEIPSDQEKDEEQEVSARISKMGSINFDDGDITQSTVVVETTKTTSTTKELINDTVDAKIDNIEPEEKEITADVQQELLSQQNVVEVKMIEVQQEISEIKEAKAGDIKDETVDVETTKTTITTKELINDTVDVKIDNIEPEEKEITADVQQELLSQQNVVEVKMIEVQQEISEIKEAKAGDTKDGTVDVETTKTTITTKELINDTVDAKTDSIEPEEKEITATVQQELLSQQNVVEVKMIEVQQEISEIKEAKAGDIKDGTVDVDTTKTTITTKKLINDTVDAKIDNIEPEEKEITPDVQQELLSQQNVVEVKMMEVQQEISEIKEAKAGDTKDGTVDVETTKTTSTTKELINDTVDAKIDNIEPEEKEITADVQQELLSQQNGVEVNMIEVQQEISEIKEAKAGDVKDGTVDVETTKTTISTKELINDTVDVKIDNIEPEEKEIAADVQQELLSQQNVVEVKMIEVQQEISEIKEAKAGDIKDGTLDVETTKTTITAKELINDTVDAKIDNIEPEEKEITADVQQELLSQQNVVEVKMIEVQQEISEIKEAKAGDIKDGTDDVETTKTTITTKELINDTVDAKIDNIEPEEKEITADVQQELLSQQNVVEVKMMEVQQEISEINEAKAGDIKDGTDDVETTKTTITTKELINDTVDAKIDNIEPEEKEITADVQQELLSQQNVVEVKMMEFRQEISDIKEAKAGDIKDVNNTDQEKSETEIISSTTAVTRLSEEDKDLMKKVMGDLIGEDDEETQTIKGIKKENVTKETITITTSEVTQTNDDDNELMKEVMDDLINKTDASEEKAQIDEQTKVERQEDSTLTKTTTTTVITTEVTETTSDQTEQLNIAPEVEITPTTATDLSGTVITTTMTTLHSKDRIEAEQSEKNMNKEDEALMKEVMEDLLDDEDQVKESTPELQQQMSMDEIIKYEVTDVASAPKASEVNDVQEISSVSTVTTTTITTTKTLIDDTGFQQQESMEDDVVIEYDVSETQNVVIEQLTSEASPTVESVPYVQQESTEEDTVIKYDVEISKAEGASSESIESSIESSETYISSEGIGEKVYVESPDNSISSDGVEEKVTTKTTFTTTTSSTTVNTTGK
ncbi:unnamed protein product [Owenia fusiformis]|uniref:Uncharacterized protein n=1 Tax=Owenia fusiformis TaxID=6347 RepID=A0A8S4MYU4_OWEFU|nr:unnamed protein product [Owenia fusiformis]